METVDFLAIDALERDPFDKAPNNNPARRDGNGH
jgi:hypothetical protein